MKYLVVVVILALLSDNSFAQNLVPNPSFEDTVQCPFMLGQVHMAMPWYAAEATPDYFNACADSTPMWVPANTFGVRYAPTGSAYCGFWTYSSMVFYREKIGVQLTEPLTVGTTYFVSFKVSASSSYEQGCNGASSKSGALFSTVKYDLDYLPPTGNHCQVWTDNLVTDTVSWTTISGTFVADSAYQYLTLGNFFDDVHTDTLTFWPATSSTPSVQAYHYVDDVCVMANAACALVDGAHDVKKNNVLFYPNPANTDVYFNKSFVLTDLTIHNTLGQAVYKAVELPGHYLNISDYPEGMYVVKFFIRKQPVTHKLFIIHR